MDESKLAGTSVLALFEFELRLHRLGVGDAARAATLSRYRRLLDEVVNVDEAVRKEAVRLRTNAAARISAMDILIAASASVRSAILVHRDPDFATIPQSFLMQETLPPK